MFDHLEFSVADINASRRFYRAICVAIGMREIFFDDGEKSVGFGQGEVVQLLLTEGQATAPKMHVCFSADSKEAVERAHAEAVSAGGSDNGGPGYREHYGPGYFAAFVHDPDGHNVEILFREP